MISVSGDLLVLYMQTHALNQMLNQTTIALRSGVVFGIILSWIVMFDPLVTATVLLEQDLSLL